MATFRLLLEYDGTDFEGWQVQRSGRTVQGCLVAALAQITGREAQVTGSGRTDAGVHAEGQVASVRADTPLSAEELCAALNGNLPGDIAILSVGPAPEGFDARRHARSKRYRYAIWNGPVRSPLRARRCHSVHGALDLEAMGQAAKYLVGRQDFACFQAAGSAVTSTERVLHALEVQGVPGGEVQLDAEGSGFLRHMVRNIAGTLIEVGRGRRAAESMPELLASRTRSLAGPTAPAKGLTLIRVEYPEVAVGSEHSVSNPHR